LLGSKLPQHYDNVFPDYWGSSNRGKASQAGPIVSLLMHILLNVGPSTNFFDRFQIARGRLTSAGLRGWEIPPRRPGCSRSRWCSMTFRRTTLGGLHRKVRLRLSSRRAEQQTISTNAQLPGESFSGVERTTLRERSPKGRSQIPTLTVLALDVRLSLRTVGRLQVHRIPLELLSNAVSHVAQ